MTRAELIDAAMPILVALCLRFEGLYLTPYLCPAGVPTIGVGSTRYLDGTAVRLTDPAITREHAMVLLTQRLLRDFIPGVLAACAGLSTAGQLAAISDLAYNVGMGNLRGSTLRKRVNAGQWELVPAEFRKWVRAAGRTMKGLVTRREAEIVVFVGG